MYTADKWMNEVATTVDIYKAFVARPPGIEEPPQWGPRTNLWCASVSGSSTSSSDAMVDSPPLPDFGSADLPHPIVDIIDLSSSLEDNSHHRTQIKKIRNVRKSDRHHCAVCGDRPTGYHYDVLSCNGCKTFFRRTIINKRKFNCSKGGTCTFNRDFRCACRACRFEKCVKVGMNRKAIQFPSNKTAENDDIDENEDCAGEGPSGLFETKQEEYDVETTETTETGGPLTICMKNNEDFRFMHVLDTLWNREKCSRSMRRMDCPIFPHNDTLKKILKAPCLIGKHSFDTDSFREEHLRQWEKNPVRFWMVADLYLTVEFAKTFECFQNLSDSDQQSLLAHVGGIVQTASQAFYSTEMKSDSITFPDGTNALKEKLKLNNNTFMEYYRETYCKPVEMTRKLGLSSQEFVLFKTMALFSPNDMSMTEAGRKSIMESRNRLAYYLRKEMVRANGLARGTEKFANTLLALTSFLGVSEKRRNYLEVCDLMSTVQLTSLAQGVFLKRFDL